MAPPFSTWHDSLRRHRVAWQLVAAFVLVVGATEVAIAGQFLSPTVRVGLWAVLLLAAAGLLRRDWERLFGPVLLYDLVRTSRRGEAFVHRCLYAAVLVVALASVYWSRFAHEGLEGLFRRHTVGLSERARLAGNFFGALMTAQCLLVLFITPLYTASSLTEMKERRSLEFLLVTDLSNREIVFGILGARVARLVQLLLTALPILSVLEFVGGVDPVLVLAGFVATLFLTLGLGAACTLVSVHAETSLGAIVTAYLVMLCFFATCVVPLFSVSFWFSYVESGQVVGLLVGLFVFCSVQGMVAFVCSTTAVAEVRRVALRQANRAAVVVGAAPDEDVPVLEAMDEHVAPVVGWGPDPVDVRRDPRLRRVPEDEFTRWLARRPPVGGDGLRWKELFVERGLAASAGPTPVLPILLIFVLLIPFVGFFSPNSPGGSAGETFQGILRMLETLIGFGLLLVIGLSAAKRVSRERERQTLDSLRMLPLNPGEILFAKWLGSIQCVWLPWILLALLWLVGALSGAISPAAVPLLAAATLVYAGFVASLGLFFSAVSGTTLRATLLTVLSTMLILVGPGIAFDLLGGAGRRYGVNPYDAPLEGWGDVLAEYGLRPPMTFWLLTFRNADLLQPGSQGPFAAVAAAVAGLYCYLAVGALLWAGAWLRLQAEKGPKPSRRPGTRDFGREPIAFVPDRLDLPR